MPEDDNGEAMPRRRYCLTLSPAQLPYEGPFQGMRNVVPEGLSMNTVFRHVGQAMHEATELVPATDGTHDLSDRSLKMIAGAILLLRRHSCRRKGHLDISHQEDG